MLNQQSTGLVDPSLAEPSADQRQSANIKALFYVVGDADPSFLPRIVEPVAKLGHVPSRLHTSTEAGDGRVMNVDLRVVRVTQTAAERIESALRRIVGVHQVIAVYERC